MKDATELLACISRNGVIFPLSREQVHKERIHHLVVRVLAFNTQGEYLIQSRSASRDTYPGAYTDSASGHVSFQISLLFDLDKLLKKEAIRELKEEMGLSILHRDGALIRPFDPPAYSLEAFETSYGYVAVVCGKLRPNDEVNPSKTRFVRQSELERMLAEEVFVPEAKSYWQAVLHEVGDRNPFTTFFPD